MGSSLVVGTTNWVLCGRTVLTADGKSIVVDSIPNGFNMLFILVVVELAANTESPEIIFNDDLVFGVVQCVSRFQAPNVLTVSNLAAGGMQLPLSRAGEASVSQIYLSQTTPFNYALMGGNSQESKTNTGFVALGAEITKVEVKTTAEDMLTGSSLAVYGVM